VKDFWRSRHRRLAGEAVAGAGTVRLEVVAIDCK
jgi:hypothetical protein